MRFGSFAVVVSLCLGVVSGFGQTEFTPETTNVLPKPETSPADFSLIKTEAESGDMYAQYRLGRAYLNGSGVVRDYKEAVRWFGFAARIAGMGLDEWA